MIRSSGHLSPNGGLGAEYEPEGELLGQWHRTHAPTHANGSKARTHAATHADLEGF